ncbi:hypothetical protein AOLI_G00069670 [Acnodon oligacanthus]
MLVFLKETDTEVLETLKYLGVTTDKDLDWKEHGHGVYKKAEFMPYPLLRSETASLHLTFNPGGGAARWWQCPGGGAQDSFLALVPLIAGTSILVLLLPLSCDSRLSGELWFYASPPPHSRLGVQAPPSCRLLRPTPLAPWRVGTCHTVNVFSPVSKKNKVFYHTSSTRVQLIALVAFADILSVRSNTKLTSKEILSETGK